MITRKQIEKLGVAVRKRENELDAINAYLEVINQNKDE